MAFPKPRSLKNGKERGLALPASMQVAQMWDVPMKETEGDSFSSLLSLFSSACQCPLILSVAEGRGSSTALLGN